MIQKLQYDSISTIISNYILWTEIRDLRKHIESRMQSLKKILFPKIL